MPLCCVPFPKKNLLFACNGININVCIYMCDFCCLFILQMLKLVTLQKSFVFFTFNFLFTFFSKLVVYSNEKSNHILTWKMPKSNFSFSFFCIWKIVISLVTISFIKFPPFQLVRLYLISCTLVQKLPSWFWYVLQYKKVVFMKHY